MYFAQTILLRRYGVAHNIAYASGKRASSDEIACPMILIANTDIKRNENPLSMWEFIKAKKKGTNVNTKQLIKNILFMGIIIYITVINKKAIHSLFL